MAAAASSTTDLSSILNLDGSASTSTDPSFSTSIRSGVTTSSSATSNIQFSTIYVTITASSGSLPTETLNAAAKAARDYTNTVSKWTATTAFALYVLLGLSCGIGWIVRYKRQRRKFRPRTLPPEATQQGSGAFLLFEDAVPKGRGRSGTGVSTLSASTRYSFDDDLPSEHTTERRSVRNMFSQETTYAYQSAQQSSHSHSLSLEESPYASHSVSTISSSPPRSSHKNRSGIYGKGRRYNSSQTNLIPLASPPREPKRPTHSYTAPPSLPRKPPQYQNYAGEDSVESGRVPYKGRNRSSSQSTLRYYLAQGDAEETDVEYPVPMVPAMPMAAMVGGMNGNGV